MFRKMCLCTQFYVFIYRLEELQLSDNELRSLDCVLRLPRLRTLVAANNLITSFGVSKCFNLILIRLLNIIAFNFFVIV